MLNWINGTYNALMEATLDAAWERQRAISDNLSNNDTPGYKRKYVEFEKLLKEEIENIRSESLLSSRKFTSSEVASRIRNVQPQLMQTNYSAKVDENGVNVDVENIELARTQLLYSYAERMLNDNFTCIKTAIG